MSNKNRIGRQKFYFFFNVFFYIVLYMYIVHSRILILTVLILKSLKKI